jgi:hypothetical protein
MALTTVKALVVHSPWAQEIASGEKEIEYRSWPTKYRGWLAIVAARRPESRADAGRAVCLVRLVDCVQIDEKDFEWHLADPTPIVERVEIPGRLGLFDVSDLMSIHVPGASNKPPIRRRVTREIHQFLGRDPANE